MAGSTGMEWWKSDVVYQIYPRFFAGTDGGSVGDLPGIAGKLEHLAALMLSCVPVRSYRALSATDTSPETGAMDPFFAGRRGGRYGAPDPAPLDRARGVAVVSW